MVVSEEMVEGFRKALIQCNCTSRYGTVVTDSMMRVLACFTAALSDQVVGWQPIEMAPRDGTRILATGGGLGNDIEIVNYNERVGCWDAPNDTLDDRDDEPQGYSRPTLWQPLPVTPVPASTPVRSS